MTQASNTLMIPPHASRIERLRRTSSPEVLRAMGLAPLTPIEREGPETPYRVRFLTDRVSPKFLPSFPYVSSMLLPTGIIYTAVIRGTSIEDVTATVRRFWGDAKLTEAEENVNAFRDADSHLASVRLGAVRVEPPHRWYHFWRK